MKACTVCEPMGSALVFGGKDIENRRRFIGLRGVTIIHAGLSLRWFEASAWVHERWKGCPASPVLAMDRFKPRMGKAIGLVFFGDPFEIPPADGEKADRRCMSKWATGPVCYPVLARAEFSDPFPLRGNRGVWVADRRRITDEAWKLADQVEEQGQAAMLRRSA